MLPTYNIRNSEETEKFIWGRGRGGGLEIILGVVRGDRYGKDPGHGSENRDTPGSDLTDFSKTNSSQNKKEKKMKTTFIYQVMQLLCLVGFTAALYSVDTHPACWWAAGFFVSCIVLFRWGIGLDRPKVVSFSPELENDQWERMDDDSDGGFPPAEIKERLEIKALMDRIDREDRKLHNLFYVTFLVEEFEYEFHHAMKTLN